MVAETDGTNVINKYYRGANGIMYANLDGTITRYVKDGHGNVTGLTDVGATTLTKTYNYDAFGVEINKDETDINPFRYCGEYYDNELDKIYLRARYYSPIQGRFMTEDPIKDGMNWYSYCAGDPVNYWDPMGTDQQKKYDENGNIVGIRYDLRDLISAVNGVVKVENNKVYIKALKSSAVIDLAVVAEADKNVPHGFKRNQNGNLHYTMEEFLQLMNVDCTIQTEQIEVTKKEVIYNKTVQAVSKGAIKLLENSMQAVFSTIPEDSNFPDLGWAMNFSSQQKFKPILQEGVYKKQTIEINTSKGKVVLVNYIVPEHLDEGENGIIVVEHSNADITEIPYGGYQKAK